MATALQVSEVTECNIYFFGLISNKIPFEPEKKSPVSFFGIAGAVKISEFLQEKKKKNPNPFLLLNH